MDPEPAWRHRMNPPVNEIPVPLAWTAVVGRSADVAVAVVGARAYSNGVVLDLSVRLRTRPDDPHDLFDTGLFSSVFREPGPDSLLLTVEFADGRRSAGPAGPPTPDDLPADSPLLFQGGGGGSDLIVDTTYFLTPLPPAGPVTVHCAWPAAGIAATRTEFDGSVLADAQRRVETLWPPAT